MWARCRITLPQLGHNCQDTSDTKIVENHHRMTVVLTSHWECLDLHILLGAFAKLQKATATLSCLSVRLEQLVSQLSDFHEV